MFPNAYLQTALPVYSLGRAPTFVPCTNYSISWCWFPLIIFISLHKTLFFLILGQFSRLKSLVVGGWVSRTCLPSLSRAADIPPVADHVDKASGLRLVIWVFAWTLRIGSANPQKRTKHVDDASQPYDYSEVKYPILSGKCLLRRRWFIIWNGSDC